MPESTTSMWSKKYASAHLQGNLASSVAASLILPGGALRFELGTLLLVEL